MAARIIPFQARAKNIGDTGASETTPHEEPTHFAKANGPQGLHLVQAGERNVHTWNKSQQQALRIVQGVERESHAAVSLFTGRSPQFWAALPLPETRMETPLSVARRLVHLLLSPA